MIGILPSSVRDSEAQPTYLAFARVNRDRLTVDGIVGNQLVWPSYHFYARYLMGKFGNVRPEIFLVGEHFTSLLFITA